MVHEMHIAGLALDPFTNAPIVILKGNEEPEDGEERILPIWIGEAEASAIAMRLMGVDTPRPMTHDLLKQAIELLGGTVERIEVCDLQDNTFYARIEIAVGDETYVLDSRPSDAIALALRCEAAILVAQSVLDTAGQAADAVTEEGDETSGEERWQKILQGLSKQSTGKYEQ